MITIGVTGGIGSGKTTVCTYWETLGAKVIYADDLAKELMVNNRDLKNSIRKEFGDSAYFADGSLNKAWLSKQAFELDHVDRLNQLVHPEVYKETEKIKEQAVRDGVEFLVKEAALLLQKGRPSNLDYVVLILADQQQRTERVALRDETSFESIERRIEKQQDFSKLKNLADFVIENNGDKRELLQKAGNLYLNLKKKVTG